MIVPIRDIENKSFSTLATINSYSIMTLPANMGMNINNIFCSNADNYDDVRGHTMTSYKPSSRTVSMFLSKASVDYATRIEHLNNFSENKETREPIDSSQLSYATPGE